jgi:hypothetical protein
MKTAESKTTATAQHLQTKGEEQQPFFQQERSNSYLGGGSSAFFSPNQNPQPFFSKPVIQTKLTIGQPGDKYEQEADQMADQVVQRLAENNSQSQEPIAGQGQAGLKIQRKPIFESNAEPNLQAKFISSPTKTINHIQTKCADCEQEEKLQKKEQPGEEEQLQKKPIFESNGEPLETQLQTKLDHAPFLQKKCAACAAEEETPGIQRAADSVETPSASPSLESRLSSSRGGGNPLPENTRTQMEGAFGSDFSGVRVHTDSSSVQMNKELGAQAFTHGSDVYFNEGKYDDGSTEGQRLLGHELTHVVQQGGGAKINRLEEDTATGANSSTTTTSDCLSGPPYISGEYEIDTSASNKLLVLPSMSLPEFKNERYPNLYREPLEFTLQERPGTIQRENWKEYVRPHVTSKIEELFHLSPSTPINYFKSRTSNLFVFGSLNQIIEEALIPKWDRIGMARNHEIDHIKEMQLGGEDIVTNYEALDSGANGSSGRGIRLEKVNKINAGLNVFRNKCVPNLPTSYQSAKSQGYRIRVLDISWDLNLDTTGTTGFYWKLEEIMNGTHLNQIRLMSNDEIRSEIGGSLNRLFLYVSGNSGRPHHVDLPNEGGAGVYDFTSGQTLFTGFNLKRIEVRTNNNELEGGEFSGEAFNRRNSRIRKDAQNISVPFLRIPGTATPYTGQVNPQGVHRALQYRLRFDGLSPIELDTADIDENIGFVGHGRILPTAPLIGPANIEVVVEGDDARIRKLFDVSDFQLPSPFQVVDSSLELFYSGTEGLGMNGEVNFEVNNLGQGYLRGNISTGGGFELRGGFNFDSNLFDPAEITVGYVNNVLIFGGRIGIPSGKIRGIRRAMIDISYAEGNFVATGSIQPDIPGIREAGLNIAYTNNQLTIGGNLELADNIPGIRSGSLAVQLIKNENGIWLISASGVAIPNVPGINSTINISYDNGLLNINGSVNYNRGLLSGQLALGVTNGGIGEDGQPSGNITNRFTVYGGGSLTLRILPWLAATAAVRFLPNGELEVMGRIALPNSVDVFNRRSFDRTLFSTPTIEIPLFAIPVGPRSIGIVATIDGDLGVSAGIGPGQLRELFAEITYNPSHPEQTLVHGRGQFVIPADASLRLTARLGLGASVAFASLTGGVELAGSLGLNGEASAGVDVSWSPVDGLSLDAEGRIEVNPKFRFNINLFARAVLIEDMIQESWRHNLSSYEWGPDIHFGARFPIHYREGEPFSIGLDDIEFIYPELDIAEMSSGIVTDIKDQVFE